MAIKRQPTARDERPRYCGNCKHGEFYYTETNGEAVADEVSLTVYGQDERPNTGLPDDFIDLTMNGVTLIPEAAP